MDRRTIWAILLMMVIAFMSIGGAMRCSRTAIRARLGADAAKLNVQACDVVWRSAHARATWRSSRISA